MKPWEKYAAAPQGAAEGPWKKYGAAEPAQPAATPISAPGGEEEQAPRRGVGEEFMRQLGLNSRYMLTGLGGTLGMVGDPLNATVNKALGTNLQPVSQAIQGLADTIGLPKPETDLEKGVGAVATLGYGLMDPVAGAAASAIKSAKSLGGMDELYKAPGAVDVHAQAIQRGQELGYKTPPSVAKSGVAGRVLEGVGGKSRVTEIAREQNQGVTDKLARKAAGLPDDAPLTRDIIDNAIEAEVERGYGPIKNMKRILAGGTFTDDLNRIAKQYKAGDKSFPGVARNDIGELVNKYRVHQFSGEDAIAAIRGLRKQAGQAYKQGDAQMGEAQRSIAKAIEDHIDLYASRSGEAGPELLEGFRAARQNIAKQEAVKRALTGAGSVDAVKLGNAQKAGAPFTDELHQIADFANAAKQVASVPQHDAALLSPFEGLTYGGLSAFSGNPLVAGVPLGRAAIRYGLMSGPGQRLFAQPAVPREVGALPLWVKELPALNALQAGLFDQ